MALNRDPFQNKSGSIELNYLPVAAAEGRACQTGSAYYWSGAGRNGGSPVSCLNFLVY